MLKKEERWFFGYVSPTVMFQNLLGFDATQVSQISQVSMALNEAEAILDEMTVPIILRNAAPKRRREYLAGRHCARLALQAAGMEEFSEIEIMPGGAPRWPAGWVGSITHAANQVSCVVAKNSICRSLGIDSEPVMSHEVSRQVRPLVLTDAEEELTHQLIHTGWTEEECVTLFFSAKESLYKCLHPLSGIFFDFRAVAITAVNTDAETISFKLLVNLSPELCKGWTATGRYHRSQTWIHTAVALK